MLPDPHLAPGTEPRQPFQPGQTLLFIGDHTSPGDPGYVGIMSTVEGRFHPALNPNLISAGSSGQPAAGLRSRAMMEVLPYSRPDWLVIGLGLADAAGEPEAVRLMQEHLERHEAEDEALEARFGPEYRPGSGGGIEPRR